MIDLDFNPHQVPWGQYDPRCTKNLIILSPFIFHLCQAMYLSHSDVSRYS